MNQTQLQERHDRNLTRAYDDAGRRDFRHPADLIEGDETEQMVSQFADVLSPVFTFIARGRLASTMAQRSWVVLYCTSANHVKGETMAQAAARFGVKPQMIGALVKEFREALPQLRTPFQKSDATRRAMSAAHRKSKK